MSRLFGDADDEMVGWMPDSGRRGTIGLLCTCIVTLLLCVWTALHLNIPTEKSWRARARRRAIWLLFALIAPELVVFSAYQQRKEALYTANVVREFQGHPPLRSPWRKLLDWILCRAKRKSADYSDEELHTLGTEPHQNTGQPWTLVHGFYAVMGGFVIDTREAGEPFLPHGKHEATLTTCGVRFVARRALHLLPDLRKEDIQDKSKADPLVKFIVCVQAGWFCVQCIGRFASSLPLSLLELNTFAHAICTLLMYLLWWDKPLDIEQPSVIIDKAMHPLCALMAFMLGNLGPPWTTEKHRGENRVVARFRQVLRSSTGDAGNLDLHTNDVIISDQAEHRNIKTCLTERGVQGRDVANSRIRLLVGAQLDRYWQLVSEAFTLYPAPPNKHWSVQYLVTRLSPSNMFKIYVDEWTSHFEGEDGSALTRRSRNWLGYQFAAYNLDWSLVVSISVAGFFYGGLHALAWNAPFQSITQTILWRASAISLIALGPVGIPLSQIGLSVIRRNEELIFEGWVLIESTFIVATFIVISAYWTLIRTYLVVECFLNLAHSPKAVYTSIPWSEYFPHIG